MLLSLKKSSEKADGKQAAAWHPNFTDPSKLPDVKVVRTKFFVNSASIVLLGSVMYFIGNREYKVYQLNSDLQSIEAEIKSAKPESDRALATFKKYNTVEKKLTEIINLTGDALVFSDYVMHLGNTLPERVTVKRILHRGPGKPLSLAVTVEGLDEATGDLASQYVKQLQNDEMTKKFFTDITLTNSTRNTSPPSLALEISMAPKPAKK